MSISSDVTESGSPESPPPAEPKGRSLGNRLARLVVWTVLGTVVFAVVVGAFIWRSLDAIPKVPVEIETARSRLTEVTGEDLAEQQAIAADLEAQVLAAAAGADEVVVDPDFLETQRLALEDRSVDDIAIEFARAVPVADAVYDSYLLIGSDLSEALADVIIYVLLPRDGSDPVLTSLPRDLYLPNPCTQQNSRINAALNGCGEFANGPELLGLMVEDFTGIPVDHFAIVNFEGFADVVDAFGGLEICVEYPVKDSKSFLSLPAGCTQADGETVLQWVRSRNTRELVDGVWRTQEGVDDFVRQERQQQILLGMAAKLGSFSSITAFSRVVNGLAGAVTFDTGLSVPGLVQTAWDFRGIDLTTIDQVSVLTTSFRTEYGALVELPAESFTDALEAASLDRQTAGG